MKRSLLLILICLSFTLSACGYSESEMKRIQQEAYDKGFSAGSASPSYENSGSYDDGYDDGWYAAIHEMEERKKDEDSSSEADSILGAVERNLEDAVYYFFYDGSDYTESEIADLINDTYQMVVQYNESH